MAGNELHFDHGSSAPLPTEAAADGAAAGRAAADGAAAGRFGAGHTEEKYESKR